MESLFSNKFKKRLKKIIYILRNPISQLHDYKKGSKLVLESLEKLNKLQSAEKPMGLVACIIFSKDRPLQLFALLKSLKMFSSGMGSIKVIYNAENQEYEKAYQEVFSSFVDDGLELYSDSSGFKRKLSEILNGLNEKKIMFLVDDIICTKSFDLNQFDHINLRENIVSLRLGERINYCYMQDSEQSLPIDFEVENDFGSWTWGKGKLDWSYPLSVDGHLFAVDEMATMIEGISFKAPNTFEEKLQKYKTLFLKRKGICYREPVLFNNPCNMVQSEITDNNSGELNPRDLLLKWQEGLEIDLSLFKGYKNKGVHEERPLTFVSRAT